MRPHTFCCCSKLKNVFFGCKFSHPKILLTHILCILLLFPPNQFSFCYSRQTKRHMHRNTIKFKHTETFFLLIMMMIHFNRGPLYLLVIILQRIISSCISFNCRIIQHTQERNRVDEHTHKTKIKPIKKE